MLKTFSKMYSVCCVYEKQMLYCGYCFSIIALVFVLAPLFTMYMKVIKIELGLLGLVD